MRRNILPQLPNAISLVRLFSVPVLVLLILFNHMSLALWIFIGASLSDAADGYLARKFNIRSTLGWYLDPLADKILLMSMFGVFAFLKEVPLALAAIVILRDIVIFGMVLYLRKKGGNELGSPVFISKAHTLFQMVFITLILIKLAFPSPLENVVKIFSYIIVVTTFLSTFEYSKVAYRLLKR